MTAEAAYEVTPEQIETVRWWVFLAPDGTTVAEGRARLAAVGIHDEQHARAVAQALLSPQKTEETP